MLSAHRVSTIEDAAWFQAMWAPYLVADADLRIRAVNAACERVSGHPRESLIGEALFDVFPDNPANPEADGVANASASLESVFRREPGTGWVCSVTTCPTGTIPASSFTKSGRR